MRVRFGFDFEEAGQASGLNSSASALALSAAASPTLVALEASNFALTAPKLAEDSLVAGLASVPAESYHGRGVAAPAAVISAPAADRSYGGSYTGAHNTGHMSGGATDGGVNGSSGPGQTVRIAQYYDAGQARYEFSGNQDIDAVLIGSKWSSTSLTYSFPTSGSFYQTPYYDSGYLTNHVVFNAAQQTATRYALGLIYGYTLLSFTEVTESNTTHANLRFSQTTDSSLGSAEGNFPGSDSWDGDVWFGQTGQPYYLTPQIGNWGQATIMHEIGHALGLKHGHSDYTGFDLAPGGYVDGPGPRYGSAALDAAHDSWAYSLMTYRSASGYASDFQGDQFNQPQTYMQNDIAALQYLYGAWFGFNSGNTTYSFNVTTGELFVNGVGQGTPTLNGGQGKIFRTIWDGNGIDTYDFSNFTDNQSINLAPGAWSTMSAARLVDLRPLDGGVNVAPPGNLANALLYNGDLRSLIENANGGSGNDSIYGNQAGNTLQGNGGDDYGFGSTGNDTLYGALGNDTLDGWTDNDVAYGDGGDDLLMGYFGNDTLSGGIGNDVLNGEDGNDYLEGDGGNDTLSGSTGNDSYVVREAGDVISEAADAGTDLVWAEISHTLGANFENLNLFGFGYIDGTGNSLNNVINGNDYNNVLAGGGGTDTINGGAGDDVVYSTGYGAYYGGVGNDTVWAAGGYPELLDGGDGIDLLEVSTAFFDYAINMVTGVTNFATESFVNFENLNSGTGNDTLVGTSGDNIINAGAGNDNVNSSGGSDTVNGQHGNDYLYSDAFSNKTYDGGAGNDTIGGGFQYGNTWDGGADTDTLDMALHNFGPATVNLALGTYTTTNGTVNVLNFENYTGHNAVEIIIGTAGANVIITAAGNDDIDGGGGADTISGGDGNDFLHSSSGGVVAWYGDGGNDTVTGIFNYTSYIDAGADVDTLDLAYITGGIPPIAFDLATGAYTDGSGSLTLLNFENYLGQGAAETVSGTDGDNLIEGNNGNDSISGLLGGDTLNGGSGNDTVNAGTYSAADLVDGGAGNDVITASGRGTFTGGTGNDYMYAGLGTDETLDGGSSTDTIDTTLWSGDYVLDMITGLTNYAGELYINFEIAVTGAGNDSVSGTAGANRIETGAGNDWLDGLGGVDTLVGGTGDDTYVVNSASDVVVEASGEGTDTVRSSVTYTLAGINAEVLVLLGSGNYSGTGNGLSNTLYGNTGNNRLDGGTGNDTLYGGTGNDTFVVNTTGDTIVEFAGEGTDLAEASANYTLSADVENLTLMGTGNINGTGNALGNVITGNTGNNVLAGGTGDDTFYVQNAGDSVVEANGEGTDTVNSSVTWSLAGSYVETLILTGAANINGTGNGQANAIYGNTGVNSLIGGGGHDVLDGGAGADVLTGNTGDDTYYVDNAGDNVVEANGEGTADIIYSSVTYSLGGRYIESLLLTGSANINGTGNSLNQTIVGNTGDNTLTGLGGADYLDGGAGGIDALIGGTGDDTYVNGTGDTITENASEGIDTVRSGITATLGANLEVLILTGVANINGTGNTLDNALYGNDGDNVLSGGTGNDSYYVQNAGDTISEASNAGTDSVFSWVTYSIAGKQIENLTLTGAVALNATGNNLANVLTGNTLANTLDGSGGHDRLDGGAGIDTLIGGTGNDTYVVDDPTDTLTELAGQGADSVEAWTTYTLGAEVENLTLMGSAAISGTGNALNNVLTGNSNSNILTGGLGNDTYYIQNTGDNVVELSGEGTDTIYSTVTYSLSGRYAEAIILTGSANVNATGNSLTNSLTGNSGNNTLNGKGGADNLTGDLGSDLFLFETASGADTVTDFSAAQNDTININAYTAGVANNGLVTQSGANVLISLGGGNVITVLTATQADVLAHIVW
ncbi:hemolysin-type calcium-binding repeat 2 copies family protein [Asticcacaulis biprosthecium C19]|uniref:Hemolysin-type calcium-binding repeat 2 copies family protein n=1 Tax=Asticcacaulis biprosthecium C19 TaxID=715226 RepID=F4QM40_9CAUL|nr:M10 family metallopeptidase [Asticcacaulis biprosthecium]EGF93612.1 hemolysin-type calcium-binding repeat 2 copies family protein [Asticcacaulis biprosthecium C19]